jgi:hypothetical protein
VLGSLVHLLIEDLQEEVFEGLHLIVGEGPDALLGTGGMESGEIFIHSWGDRKM